MITELKDQFPESHLALSLQGVLPYKAEMTNVEDLIQAARP